MQFMVLICYNGRNEVCVIFMRERRELNGYKYSFGVRNE